MILLDVRAKEEYSVSHLEGALSMPIGTPTDQIQAQFDDPPLTSNDQIVCYCSLGYRSGKACQQLLKELPAEQQPQVYNLSGGIFKWANEGRPLVCTRGDEGTSGRKERTNKVHPFNWFFGMLLNSKSKSYS
eukprot:m.174767 g.174767  ORF g.174767 m.174767 type:complete len:132 (-) comp25285_c0_seq3:56-451(-)